MLKRVIDAIPLEPDFHTRSRVWEVSLTSFDEAFHLFTATFQKDGFKLFWDSTLQLPYLWIQAVEKQSAYQIICLLQKVNYFDVRPVRGRLDHYLWSTFPSMDTRYC